MKGLELSENYFFDLGLPMIKEKFAHYIDQIAAGLIGDGSECFGFDDEISRDHDWGPGFCVWLPREVFQTVGNELQEEILKLPRSYAGFPPRKVSGWGEGRVGVFEISQFYCNFIGKETIPSHLQDWLCIPEDALAACTNGKVFHDSFKEFSRWRAKLLEFYPEDVRLKKMASRCMTIAQAGQYNFQRCIKRKEYFAAQYAETKFCADVISMIFLLNRRYTPFNKWMHRALKSLPVLGYITYEKISEIVTSKDYDLKSTLMEEISRIIITELKNQELSDSKSDFLLDHGPQIQRRIKDEQLRQRNVWVGQ